MKREAFESAMESIVGEHNYNVAILAKFDIQKKLEMVAFACFDNPELHTTHKSDIDVVKMVRDHLQKHGTHGMS